MSTILRKRLKLLEAHAPAVPERLKDDPERDLRFMKRLDAIAAKSGKPGANPSWVAVLESWLKASHGNAPAVRWLTRRIACWEGKAKWVPPPEQVPAAASSGTSALRERLRKLSAPA